MRFIPCPWRGLFLTWKAYKRVNSNSRNPFSSDDDEYLVKFLANRIPFKESGGRSGNGVYKDLCSDQRVFKFTTQVAYALNSIIGLSLSMGGTPYVAVLA